MIRASAVISTNMPYGRVMAWKSASDVAREVISATRKKKTVKKRPSKFLQKPGIFTSIRPFLSMSMVLKA